MLAMETAQSDQKEHLARVGIVKADIACNLLKNLELCRWYTNKEEKAMEFAISYDRELRELRAGKISSIQKYVKLLQKIPTTETLEECSWFYDVAYSEESQVSLSRLPKKLLLDLSNRIERVLTLLDKLERSEIKRRERVKLERWLRESALLDKMRIWESVRESLESIENMEPLEESADPDEWILRLSGLLGRSDQLTEFWNAITELSGSGPVRRRIYRAQTTLNSIVIHLVHKGYTSELSKSSGE